MFILASKSPRRVEILEQAGFNFICCPSNINESDIIVYPPFTPIKLATSKASDIAAQYPDKIVIGADTVIYFQDRVIGKPKNIYEARQILLTLSAKTHQVITGISIIRSIDNTFCSFAETSYVQFKKLNNKIIDDYFAKVNPLDKAGAYAIQEHGNMIIKNIKGSRNNIIGLPTEKLFETLNILLKN